MFLLMAVACLLIGMLVLVWSAVVKETEKVTYDENLKVIIRVQSQWFSLIMCSLQLHLQLCWP